MAMKEALDRINAQSFNNFMLRIGKEHRTTHLKQYIVNCYMALKLIDFRTKVQLLMFKMSEIQFTFFL